MDGGRTVPGSDFSGCRSRKMNKNRQISARRKPGRNELLASKAIKSLRGSLQGAHDAGRLGSTHRFQSDGI